MSTVVTNIKISYKKQETWSKKYIAIGITACIGGLIFQLITGSLYQWGIINIYVTSYFKTLDPSVTLQSNAVAFPIMMFCMGLPMSFGIYLAEVTHPMFVLLSCQILLSISVFISSYMTSMWIFIFFYGILFGLLVGSAFMIPIVECNKYFPGMKNYVNGTILVGTGSGSVVFGMFSYSYLNPNQLKPLLGYYLGIGMMSPVIIGNRRKENQEKQKQKQKQLQNERNRGVENNIIQPHVSTNISNVHQARSLKQAFFSTICWIQVLIVLLVACGLYLINGNYKTYVKKTINDDYFLTITGAIGAIGNGCSRFVWNIFFLKTGYKTVMLIILSILIIVFSTIRFTVEMKQIYLIEVFFINICVGGLLVTTPTVAQAIYGQKTGSSIYGFYWQIVASANFIQYLFVSNLSKSIGFDNIIQICLGMSCLAIPIIILTKFQGPWENDTSALEYCIGNQANKVKNIDETLQVFQHQLQNDNNNQNVRELPSPKKKIKLQSLKGQNIVNNQQNKIQLISNHVQGQQNSLNQIMASQSKQIQNELPIQPQIGIEKKSSNLPSTQQVDEDSR